MRRDWWCVSLLALWAAAASAQQQVNPQVNTGIYASSGPGGVRYAGQSPQGTTLFNAAAKASDVRLGMADTGVYAANGVINGRSGADQAYRPVPITASPRPAAGPAPSPSVRYNSSPYAVSAPAYSSSAMPASAMNAQVNGRINGAR